MLFDKYLIGEYHMIKTIATITQTTPTLTGYSVFDQCVIWQNEGKYTGKAIITFDADTKIKRAERWEWIDYDTAEAYKNLVLTNWIDLYPDVNVDIVVE
jgi:hypothetical protein